MERGGGQPREAKFVVVWIGVDDLGILPEEGKDIVRALLRNPEVSGRVATDAKIGIIHQSESPLLEAVRMGVFESMVPYVAELLGEVKQSHEARDLDVVGISWGLYDEVPAFLVAFG